MSVELVYETHSMTVDNETGYATGWLPGELSAEGRRQAVLLGERRRPEHPAAVYSSDLARAEETARLAFGDGYRTDPRLRECNYGELNGAPVDRVTAERLQHVDVPFPGGESYRDVVARTEAFLHDMRARHDGERIVVIAHSANRWAIEHLLDGTPLDELLAAPFDWRPGWVYLLP